MLIPDEPVDEKCKKKRESKQDTRKEVRGMT